jgi:hypothetical protein
LSRARTVSCLVSILSVAVGAVACGGSKTGGIAVRVGGHDIAKATVAHWMAVMAPDHIVPDPPRYTACIARQEVLEPQAIATVLKEECRELFQQMRKQALDYLISSQWQIGVARELGLEASKPGTDVNFAAEAEAVSARISRAVTSRAPEVTPVEIAAYYRRNIQRYGHREQRYIEIVEGLSSQAAARSAMNKVALGGSLSSAAFHESVERRNLSDVLSWKRALERAIFVARPHVLVGPLLFLERWCFFEVTRIIPAVVQPLARVRGAIKRQLTGEQRQRTLAAFIAAWRRRWLARTDCSPEYVVQKCKQYTGGRAEEEPLAFD